MSPYITNTDTEIEQCETTVINGTGYTRLCVLRARFSRYRGAKFIITFFLLKPVGISFLFEEYTIYMYEANDRYYIVILKYRIFFVMQIKHNIRPFFFLFSCVYFYSFQRGQDRMHYACAALSFSSVFAHSKVIYFLA